MSVYQFFSIKIDSRILIKNCFYGVGFQLDVLVDDDFIIISRWVGLQFEDNGGKLVEGFQAQDNEAQKRVGTAEISAVEGVITAESNGVFTSGTDALQCIGVGEGQEHLGH